MSASERAARKAAEEYRQRHALGVAPLGDLVSLIEHTEQVDVAILEGNSDAHGLTVRDPIRAAVIVAATTTPHPVRQRSTLAHELGHILFSDYTSDDRREWGARSPDEVRADSFARHLLVPIEGLVKHLDDHGHKRNAAIPLSVMSRLVQEFKASPQLVAIQLAEAGRITEMTKRDMAESLSTPLLAAKFGWADQYKGWQQESQQRRAPQKLLARVTEAYLSGILPAAFVARLRQISEDDLQAELDASNVTPETPAQTEAIDLTEFLPPDVT